MASQAFSLGFKDPSAAPVSTINVEDVVRHLVPLASKRDDMQ